jgi:hypothetical protein
LASATLNQMHAAFAQADPLPALRRIGADLQTRIERQSDQAQRELGRAERNLALVEGTRTGADAAMFVGAFLVTGGSSVALGYGVGSGYADGGPIKAVENGLRTVSQTVDVAWGAYDGYTARDPQTGAYRGWAGAAENAATVFAVNVAMGTMAKRLFGGDAPVPVSPATPRPAGKPGASPRFEAFKTGDERLADDLAAVAKKFAGRPASDPDLLAITRGANDVALANLAKQDPELVASILRVEAQHSSVDLGALSGGPAPGSIGVGWLWSRLWDGSSHQPPAATSTGKLPANAELKALGSRCQQAARVLETTLATRPPDSSAAQHFRQLQTLLRSGAADPASALGAVRRMTGYELATVLSEIEGGH